MINISNLHTMTPTALADAALGTDDPQEFLLLCGAFSGALMKVQEVSTAGLMWRVAHEGDYRKMREVLASWKEQQ